MVLYDFSHSDLEERKCLIGVSDDVYSESDGKEKRELQWKISIQLLLIYKENLMEYMWCISPWRYQMVLKLMPTSNNNPSPCLHSNQCYFTVVKRVMTQGAVHGIRKLQIEVVNIVPYHPPFHLGHDEASSLPVRSQANSHTAPFLRLIEIVRAYGGNFAAKRLKRSAGRAAASHGHGLAATVRYKVSKRLPSWNCIARENSTGSLEEDVIEVVSQMHREGGGSTDRNSEIVDWEQRGDTNGIRTLSGTSSITITERDLLQPERINNEIIVKEEGLAISHSGHEFDTYHSSSSSPATECVQLEPLCKAMDAGSTSESKDEIVIPESSHRNEADLN
ncbi:hypothetical protein C5167_031868 [Papaver somniferum]|uniref:Uncharacterized protein n=1 Tax=Papaver somniferum TaxID=3469 RepID=A0A4Y7K8L8_PAPSO|nr:hypothetical protein C5167_031868 [Papaver somniferum]